MKNLHTSIVQGQWHYSVYNSRGDLALWTTNRPLAEYYARAFARNPGTTEILVGRAISDQPKRK